MHSFDGQEDERFLSGNSLAQGIIEDNVGSSITGTLLVNFDDANSTTTPTGTVQPLKMRITLCIYGAAQP